MGGVGNEVMVPLAPQAFKRRPQEFEVELLSQVAISTSEGSARGNFTRAQNLDRSTAAAGVT